MSQPALVKRPLILVLALLILAAGAAAAGAGLWNLAQRRAAAPAVVAIDQDKLADALGDSPWISSQDHSADDNADQAAAGPRVLWYVTAPDCAPCREFERTTMPILLNSGIEVRAILVAPRTLPENTRAAEDVAELLKARDWTGLQLWMQGKREAGGQPLDPGEEDGFLEWGRQSGERIAALMKRNGLRFAAPALFWKSGLEWRASTGADAPEYAQIERELAPGS